MNKEKNRIIAILILAFLMLFAQLVAVDRTFNQNHYDFPND